MSVGAGSIKRAAKTETKAAVIAKPAEETVKAATPVKKAPAKKAPAKKAPAKNPAAKKPVAKAAAPKPVAPKSSYAIGEELPIFLR